MRLIVNIVDAFTGTQFRGNSAAVIITHKWLTDDVMQNIAMENNLSETAFLVKLGERYHIRWFSPITEIDFCGHATLAACSVIFTNDASLQSIVLHANAVGDLTVTKGKGAYIEMDFPSTRPTEVKEVPQVLLDGLSSKPLKVLKNKQAYFVVYLNEQAVRDVAFDSEKIKLLAPFDVVVTAPGIDSDFVSRYFWPANGGDEDPVTGSIHTGLAPYWAEILGKKTLVAHQVSRRGGVLRCEVVGERVIISGNAVPYLTGEIHLQDR